MVWDFFCFRTIHCLFFLIHQLKRGIRQFGLTVQYFSITFLLKMKNDIFCSLTEKSNFYVQKGTIDLSVVTANNTFNAGKYIKGKGFFI